MLGSHIYYKNSVLIYHVHLRGKHNLGPKHQHFNKLVRKGNVHTDPPKARPQLARSSE